MGDEPFCAGPEWQPYRGTCGACGAPLTGRSQWFCDKHCKQRFGRNHWWGTARDAAIKRDGGCVREGCDARDRWAVEVDRRLEVNHIEPRNGAGYGNGCHHHMTNLETLCHRHHLVVTAEQRAKKTGAAQDA